MEIRYLILSLRIGLLTGRWLSGGFVLGWGGELGGCVLDLFMCFLRCLLFRFK